MRKKSKLIRKKFIFISIIVSLSIMGVGYAAWNDGTSITASLSTGFVWPSFYIDNNQETFRNGEKLLFTVSDDGQKLSIDGEVFSDFNEDIIIKIIDKGTIPSMFTESDKEKKDDEISELNSYGKQRSNLSINSEYIEFFELNINTNSGSDDNTTRLFNETSSELSDGISGIERKIEELEAEIALYEREESFNFKYVLKFQQGVGFGNWNKKLNIDGNIRIVPNPEVLDNMIDELKELYDQLEIEKAYIQQLLMEQQKLLEEQKLLEQQQSEEPENNSEETIGEPKEQSNDSEGRSNDPEGTSNEPEERGNESEGRNDESEKQNNEPEKISEPERSSNDSGYSSSDSGDSSSESGDSSSESGGSSSDSGGSSSESGGSSNEV